MRQFHADKPNWLQHVGTEFVPGNFGQWFYDRVKEWAAKNSTWNAYVHIFRKTGLQHAREGEDIDREVAADARVGESVLTTHYVTKSEAQLRAGSNRTFRRILASLPVEVATRYGHEEPKSVGLEQRLQAAMDAKDWALVAELSAELAQQNAPGDDRVNSVWFVKSCEQHAGTRKWNSQGRLLSRPFSLRPLGLCKEAPPGFEPGMADLQSAALPLG